MKNIFYYLKQYENFSFLEVPFNEVDSLILSAFTYIDISDIVKENGSQTIYELYFLYHKISKETLFQINQNRLFYLLSKSRRFSKVIVKDYLEEIDKNKEMQITGMTFVLPNDIIYIAFRGTEELVGWKEDFDLSYKPFIPSQKKAVQYVDTILEKINNPVYLGGHSKGGNLAMYAALFCKQFDKIVQIYNYDGPGFTKDIVNSENYQMRKSKIITFIPKASIVGNLFNQDTKIKIIKSKTIGFLQHNLYSWETKGIHFVYENEFDKETLFLCNMFNNIIMNLPSSYKKEIIDTFYALLNKTNINEVEEYLKNITFPLKEMAMIKYLIQELIKKIAF